jgi:hypothetical protein
MFVSPRKIFTSLKNSRSPKKEKQLEKPVKTHNISLVDDDLDEELIASYEAIKMRSPFS